MAMSNSQSTSSIYLTKSHQNEIAVIDKEIFRKADQTMLYFIFGFFFLGILISPIYQTYTIAIVAGGLSLLVYFLVKAVFSDSSVLRYIVSFLFSIWIVQFIYQMHGLGEMQFLFFLIAALMIIYKDWKVLIPIAIVFVIHHLVFNYLQKAVNPNIQLSQSNNGAFALLFHYTLFMAHIVCCSWLCIKLRNQSIKEYLTIDSLKEEIANNDKNLAFASQISEGNLEATFDVANNNILGSALITMRENLKAISKQDAERNWAAEGIAQVSEILRVNNSNLNLLAEEVLAYVIKYLNSNQGAFYIIKENEEGNEYIELASCYAYNRKKFITKKIQLGEGLVGQAALEKEPIYLTEIPIDYVKITSGLGNANPTNILIVPFVVNEKVHGIIEICSFKKMLDHEREFLTKISESIGSSIQAVKTNESTKKLLEESQSMTEVLKGQEEEMRQNLEEMESTQEEMRRLGSEMEGQLKAINTTMATIEFDLNGSILTANENFLTLMKYRFEEIKGKHHQIFVDSKERNSDEYKEFWNKLRQGKAFDGEFSRIDKTGKEIFIKGIYNPIYDSKGNPIKIFKLCYDITEQRALIKEANERLMKA